METCPTLIPTMTHEGAMTMRHCGEPATERVTIGQVHRHLCPRHMTAIVLRVAVNA